MLSFSSNTYHNNNSATFQSLENQLMESSAGLRWRRFGSPRPIKTKGRSSKVLDNGPTKENKNDMAVPEQEEEEPLSPSARLFHEPNFNVHVTAIMGSKVPISPQVIKQNLVHTLLKHPRFSSSQVIDI